MKLSKKLLTSFAAALLFALPLTASPAPYKQLNPGQEVIDEPETMVNGAGHRTTHNGSNHVYVGTTLFGDQIELEDGSYWMTNPDDRYKLKDWNPGDPLMIMQDTARWWFSNKSSFPYVIKNERTWESVEVENTAAPIYDGAYRRYIIDINKPARGEGTLKLNDGSVWVLQDNRKDRDSWTLWQVNDTIIIGSNNSIFYYFIPDILINVTCSDQYVPSRCVN